MNVTATTLTRELLYSIVMNLLQSDFETISSEEKDKYGCAPLFDCFYLHVSAEGIAMIEKLPGWVSVDEYPNKALISENEVGCIGNLRVILNNSMILVASNKLKWQEADPQHSVTIEIKNIKKADGNSKGLVLC